ncbi:uncharacterized protein Dvar_08080 [Desulfosarcina variabilis str. Montpellier]|uniref:hypothetical protein n=1 Tax=Desulfosarcina variabilis TaxID=2300 RepID=UPI003AFAF8A8
MKNDLLRIIGFLFFLLACQSDYLLNAEFDDQSLFQLPFPTVSTQPVPASDSTITPNANGQETNDLQSVNTQAGKDIQVVKLLSIVLIGFFLIYRRKNGGVNADFKSPPDTTKILRPAPPNPSFF